MKKYEDVRIGLKIDTIDIIKLIEEYNIKISKQLKYNYLKLKEPIPIKIFLNLDEKINRTADIYKINDIFIYYYSNWNLYKEYIKQKKYAHA